MHPSYNLALIFDLVLKIIMKDTDRGSQDNLNEKKGLIMKKWILTFIACAFLVPAVTHGDKYKLTRASSSSDWSSSTTVEVKSGEIFNLTRTLGDLNGYFQSFNMGYSII